MRTRNKPAIVVLTAAAYAALFELNTLLFSAFSFSTGVDWIYLPSGLRLAFVLVFGVWGALGIILASIAIDFIHYFNADVTTAVVTGLISGASPLLARTICVDRLGLNKDLTNLTTGKLLNAAVIFSVLSATLHQLWFTFRGHTENFISSAAVMALGDLTGAILILYLAKYLFSQLTLHQFESKPPEL
jgi:hypothetical protein